MFNKKILNKAYRNFYLKSRTYDMTRHMQDQVLENVTTELLDEKIDSIINNDSTKYSKDELSSIKKEEIKKYLLELKNMYDDEYYKNPKLFKAKSTIGKLFNL